MRVLVGRGFRVERAREVFRLVIWCESCHTFTLMCQSVIGFYSTPLIQIFMLVNVFFYILFEKKKKCILT